MSDTSIRNPHPSSNLSSSSTPDAGVTTQQLSSVENSNGLPAAFTPPSGWSADEARLEDLAETGFPGVEHGLPGPYKALMYEGRMPFTFIIVRCGGPESASPSDPLPQYVEWYGGSVQFVRRIDEPKTFNGILKAMHEAAKHGRRINPYHSCKTTKLEDLYPGSDPPRYLEIPDGWILERHTEPVLPASLNGDLYGIVPCQGSSLRNSEGSVYIIECLKQYTRAPGLGEEGAERVRRFPWLVRWDQSKDLLQTIEAPGNFDDFVYYMKKEERKYGKVIWSNKTFSFVDMESVGEKELE